MTKRPTYALVLSDDELARYRLMAEMAAAEEADDWAAAGVTAGARVADVGCGPGAVLAVLAETVGPTGAVLGVDRDPAAVRYARHAIAGHPHEHYRTFHARRGADLRIGLRLGALLEEAGLVVERYRSIAKVLRLAAGIRGPQWAAREAMVAEGVATGDDVARWDAAYARMDDAEDRPWSFVSVFLAVGRRPLTA